MNNDKAAEEIKNLFADFKILATKVNDGNKNRKKRLQQTKKILKHVNKNIKNCFMNTIL